MLAKNWAESGHRTWQGMLKRIFVPRYSLLEFFTMEILHYSQNICADKYTYKERYYVCYEATKIVRKKGALLSRLQLGADSELRRIRCRERRVYFSYKTNGTYGSTTRMLYQCPIADVDRNHYLFGQGKHRNEIGIYDEIRTEEGRKEIWFYGVMKDIDLDTFGKQLYRKNIKLIH